MKRLFLSILFIFAIFCSFISTSKIDVASQNPSVYASSLCSDELSDDLSYIFELAKDTQNGVLQNTTSQIVNPIVQFNSHNKRLVHQYLAYSNSSDFQLSISTNQNSHPSPKYFGFSRDYYVLLLCRIQV